MKGYYYENIRTNRISGNKKSKLKKQRSVANTMAAVKERDKIILNRERQTIARAVHLDRLIGLRQKWQHHDMQYMYDDNM